MRKIPAFDCRTKILKLWTKFLYSPINYKGVRRDS